MPRADEHQGEYVPRRSQRLAWLTGFRGSAGLAIVLADTAAIFIDGRYTLAVRAQVDTDAFVPLQIPEESPEAWIAANLPKGGRLGFDPWLQTVDGHERFARAAARAGGSFVPVEQNPIDAVWRDRPAPPLAPVLPHPVEFAGETSEQRRRRIADIVAAKGADVALPHRARFDRLAAQRARRRRAAHALRAGLRAAAHATAMSISTWTAARSPIAPSRGSAMP